ncbi:MAG: hypothetical protein K0S22_735 [Oscillospiraceae bacterium]|jgi:hypothetical protein|nr:hypothetical protein [Oscillospiraceae bacterium]
MNQGVFTEGIDHGGLTTDYEIRILICWLLHKMKMPVTSSQLSSALLGESLVNYFEVTCALGELLTSGHLTEVKADGQQGHVSVTELGRKTAETFYKSIPRTVREKALDALSQCVLQERFAKENRAEIVETNDGFRLELSLNDVGNDLMSVSLYAPTREVCEMMKKNFISDPTVLYRAVLSVLMGSTDSAIEFIGHEPL